jgi:hypothetical protein
MDDLLTGSTPSWLSAAAPALSPLIALLVGFVGADRWLFWRLRENCHHAPAGGDQGVKLRPLPRSAG